MHGAGIANTMHMPVGTKYCCGVVEIFPQGMHFLNVSVTLVPFEYTPSILQIKRTIPFLYLLSY
jgi:hypothetical protein